MFYFCLFIYLYFYLLIYLSAPLRSNGADYALLLFIYFFKFCFIHRTLA